MDITQHTQPERLEYYSFVWSEVRLIIAAVALFIGGAPPIYLIAPTSFFSLAQTGLTVAWLISGVSAVYLLYRWYGNGMKVFGGKETKDTLAFIALVVSGINLGLVPLLGKNIGMSILSGRGIFFITGIIYLVVAYYLYNRWKSHGERLFS